MAPRKSVFFIVCLSARSYKRTSEYARLINNVDSFGYDDYNSLNQLAILSEFNVDQFGQFD